MLRSCYASEWRFPGIDEPVKGQFYFNADAPFYDGFTYFGSRNWHQGDGTPWPEYGETEEAKQRWRNGRFPGPFPSARTVGTREQIEGDAPVPPPEGAYTFGLPLACWEADPPRDYCGDGGDGDDGTAEVTLPVAPLVSGGEADDGTAVVSLPRVYTSAGGDGDDGTAEVIAAIGYASAGGDGDDGTAEVTPPDPGVSIGPCTGVPVTLGIALNTFPPNTLDGTGTVLAWNGTAFVGTITACFGTVFSISVTGSGANVILTITAGPFSFGPEVQDVVSCAPFNALWTGPAAFPPCGGGFNLTAAVSEV